MPEESVMGVMASRSKLTVSIISANVVQSIVVSEFAFRLIRTVFGGLKR